MADSRMGDLYRATGLPERPAITARLVRNIEERAAAGETVRCISKRLRLSEYVLNVILRRKEAGTYNQETLMDAVKRVKPRDETEVSAA